MSRSVVPTLALCSLVMLACDDPRLQELLREALTDGPSSPPPPVPPDPGVEVSWTDDGDPGTKTCRTGPINEPRQKCPRVGSACPRNYPHIGCDLDGNEAILTCAPIDGEGYEAGVWQLICDGRNAAPVPAPAGCYYARVESPAPGATPCDGEQNACPDGAGPRRCGTDRASIQVCEVRWGDDHPRWWTEVFTGQMRCQDGTLTTIPASR